MEGLRQKRRGAGMSQEELAKMLGVKQHTVSSYETGRNDPSIEVLKKLMEIFRCHAEELF